MSAPRRGRGDTGAVLVEAALVLPILLMVVMGMIEFSTQELKNGQMTSAARDGARVGILHYSGADTITSGNCVSGTTPASGNTAYDMICKAVQGRLAGTQMTGMTVTCSHQDPDAGTWSTTTCSSAVLGADAIQVSVTWSRTPLTFVGSLFLPSSKTVTSSARMVIVGSPS
jgi:Flp pilus assembly protein TadG